MTHGNGARPAPQVGELVDLAAFGKLHWWSGTQKQDLHTHPIVPEADGTLRPVRDAQTGEWHLGVEWDETRDVRQVAVTFASDVPPDLQGAVRRFQLADHRTGAAARRPRAGSAATIPSTRMGHGQGRAGPRLDLHLHVRPWSTCRS